MCANEKSHEQAAMALSAMIPPCQTVKAGFSILLAAATAAAYVGNASAFTAEMSFLAAQALDREHGVYTDKEHPDRPSPPPGFDEDALPFLVEKGVEGILKSVLIAMAMFREDGDIAAMLRELADSVPEGIVEAARQEYDKEFAERLGAPPRFSEDGTEILDVAEAKAVDQAQFEGETIGDLADLPVLDHDPGEEALGRFSDDGNPHV